MRAARSRPALMMHAGLAALLSLAASAHAQSTSPDPRLRPVDAGRQDTGPLSTSTRVTQLDLRLPLGFDKVYRIDGSSPASSKFARKSGGLTAVFNRSQYMQVSNGAMVAEIPAGTTFYIGNLPQTVSGPDRPQRERTLPSTYVDMSAHNGRASSSARTDQDELSRTAARSAALGAHSATPLVIPGDRGSPPAALNPQLPAALPRRPAPPRPSVFSDESYRQKKINTLLDKAAAQTKEQTTKPDPDAPNETTPTPPATK